VCKEAGCVLYLGSNALCNRDTSHLSLSVILSCHDSFPLRGFVYTIIINLTCLALLITWEIYQDAEVFIFLLFEYDHE